MADEQRVEDPGRAIRETALDFAVRYHQETASSATTPAGARTIVGTAQTFAEFLEGLADVAGTRHIRRDT